MSTPPPVCTTCGEKPRAQYRMHGRDYFRGLCRDCYVQRQNAISRLRRAGVQPPPRGAPLTAPVPDRRRVESRAPAPVAGPPPAARPARVIVVASDVHIPEHDRGAWSVFLEVVRRVRPDEVWLLGDFGEYESVSSHSSTNENRLSDDVVAVRRALNEVRDAAGAAARIVYAEGNHETRLLRAIAARMPSAVGALTLPELLDLDDRGIEWVPQDRQPIERGLLRALHGHQIYGQGGGPIYHSRKAADVYATAPGVVVTYGHTHKPQQYQRPVLGGVARAVGLGCLRTIRPDEVRWLQGNEAGWAHGFAVFSVLDASVHVEEVRPVRGQAVFRGELVGSRLEVPDGSAS